MRKSNSTRGIVIFVSILSLGVASLLGSKTLLTPGNYLFSQICEETASSSSSTPTNMQVHAQDKIQGESTIYDLSSLVKGDEIKQTTIRSRAAVSELKNAAGHAKAIVLEAKKAFEKDPSRKAEADLVLAIAKGRAYRFQAMAEYRLAAQAQGKANDAVLDRLKIRKAALEAEIEEKKREGETLLAKVAKVERALAELAKNIDSFAGPNGKLEPALSNLVERLDWLRNQALQDRRNAVIAQKQAEAHFNNVDVLERRLRKAKGSLKHSADATVLMQERLSQIARWEGRALPVATSPGRLLSEAYGKTGVLSRYPCPIGPRCAGL